MTLERDAAIQQSNLRRTEPVNCMVRRTDETIVCIFATVHGLTKLNEIAILRRITRLLKEGKNIYLNNKLKDRVFFLLQGDRLNA